LPSERFRFLGRQQIRRTHHSADHPGLVTWRLHCRTHRSCRGIYPEPFQRHPAGALMKSVSNFADAFIMVYMPTLPRSYTQAEGRTGHEAENPPSGAWASVGAVRYSYIHACSGLDTAGVAE